MSSMDPKARQLKKRLVKILVGVFILLIVGGLFAVSAYYYQKYQKSQALLTSQGAPLDETKKIIAQIGALMQLPQGEEPTVATVTNVEELKQQQFFQNAKNGDKVLIYDKAKRAILYRPSTNKIIDVAPLNLTQPTPTVSPGVVAGISTAPTLTPTVTVIPARKLQSSASASFSP